MTEIRFNKNFPEMLQPKVSEIISRFEWILPTWLQLLQIHYDGGDEDSAAFMTIDKDYRFANLTVCGHWADGKPETQIEQIIHELIHIHFSPLKNYAVKTIEAISGDETLRTIVKDELTSKNEQATQDLAFAIANRFKDV